MPRGQKSGYTNGQERGAMFTAAGYGARGHAKPTPLMSRGQPSTKRRAAANDVPSDRSAGIKGLGPPATSRHSLTVISPCPCAYARMEGAGSRAG